MDKDEDAQLSLAKDAAPGAAPPGTTPGDPSPPGQFPVGSIEGYEPAPTAPAAPDAAATPVLGPRAEAFIGGAAYGALGLLGALLGVVGSFLQDWTIGSVPVAAVLLVILNFGFIRLAGWAMDGRMGAVIPTLTWTVVVFIGSQQRPEGDLIVPGTLAGYVFLIGGLVAAVIAVSMVPSRRPPGDWLLGSAGRTRG
ncbi:DUF6113 family protein [Actinomadura rudentiformis]|uniref:Uncharacterized protein n=1 Tax=Actinomadura rudentiformis TaxID=359158 RepID=A0A6H9YLN1_9ACTN|nr:DUF6113 family protein [Actinomadura rudentiformis]KAB2341264.1 hypothetical protein F8566_41830 [Actinomadura rudentiformis]